MCGKKKVSSRNSVSLILKENLKTYPTSLSPTLLNVVKDLLEVDVANEAVGLRCTGI